MKVLACLVNYNNNQLWCLERLIKEYKSMEGFDVDIVVHSNVELPYEGIQTKIITGLDDWNLMPYTCRKTIYDNKDNYDLFIYSENDHLITERNLTAFLKATNLLPENIIVGFFQYENYENIGKFYPGAHVHFQWIFNSLFAIPDTSYVFASYTNVHQATFVLTKKQLHKAINEMDFLTPNYRSGYTIKCAVNTDVYLRPKWRKVLCLSHWEDFLIQHLPQRYLSNQGCLDRDFDPIIVEMCRQVRKMKFPYKYNNDGLKKDFSMNLHDYFE